MNPEIGAYFYPVTRDCSIRQSRARMVGREVADETELIKNAGKLFPEHDQPREYGFDGDTRNWDDADPRTMARQVEIAEDYLDFFIFDTYMGEKDGEFVHEVQKPLDDGFIPLEKSSQMKFGLMLSQNSPRVVLPISPSDPTHEPGRKYKLNANVARKIVDRCAEKYWNKRNYFHIDGNPYLSVWVADALADSKTNQETAAFLYELLNYSHQKYDIDPHLVGVLKRVEDVDYYLPAGATNFTGYAFLADFQDTDRPIQDYNSLMIERINDWGKLAERGVAFIPPAVVGWDSSPRGKNGFLLDDVAGVYPYTPVVINGNDKSFEEMLLATIKYTNKHNSTREKYGLICAWNEISEGCALLPRIRNGEIDIKYLEAINSVRKRINESL